MWKYNEESQIIKNIKKEGASSVEEIMHYCNFLQHKKSFIVALLMKLSVQGFIKQINDKYVLLKKSV